MQAKSPKKLSQICVIGGNGFIGSQFLHLSKKADYPIISPSHKQLDITNKSLLKKYFKNYQVSHIINFAAFTNIDVSEKEWWNKNGITWKTNFLGVKHLVDISRYKNIFYIHISTDAVFPGTEKFPGPYFEDSQLPKNGEGLNWYGYTKLSAEKEILKLKNNFAIIRISHPFGNLKSKRDLIVKTIQDIQIGNMLFTDQFFTPTFIGDLNRVIWKIFEKNIQGIFHVGCKKRVSRMIFDRYLAKKCNIKTKLIKGSLKKFIEEPGHAPRTRLGGFDTKNTEKKLGITFHTWQEALDEVLTSSSVY